MFNLYIINKMNEIIINYKIIYIDNIYIYKYIGNNILISLTVQQFCFNKKNNLNSINVSYSYYYDSIS